MLEVNMQKMESSYIFYEIHIKIGKFIPESGNYIL